MGYNNLCKLRQTPITFDSNVLINSQPISPYIGVLNFLNGMTVTQCLKRQYIPKLWSKFCSPACVCKVPKIVGGVESFYFCYILPHAKLAKF